MSYTINQLRSMTDEELIIEHDKTSKGTLMGVSYYLEELSRRTNERLSTSMLNYTKAITILTIVITIATFINIWMAFKLLQ